MIVDHRTYTLHPGSVTEFLEVYEAKGLPLQLKYLGDPLGWYLSNDIGGLNQVIHLWRYEGFADREKRRAAMKADPGWQDYAQAALPLIQRMQNKILTAAPFFQP